MVYKKVTFFSIVIAVVACVVSNITFASTDILANDEIYDSVMNVLIFLQKYSWPVVTLIFIYAMYQYYVIGSEKLEYKILGQRLIVGIAIFMAIFQCLPLAYAFLIV